MSSFQIPDVVLKIHGKLRENGYDAYLVGGCVRDLLLKRTPKDWDLTTNANPQEIQTLFDETFYENDFGTVGVVTETPDPRLRVVEITPFREEGKYTDSRRPDEIRWAETIEKDLERRDFTINAMAYEPTKDLLVDLHHGQQDLDRRVIATVGNPDERFAEDALRMMRAVRLAAELDFALDPQTAGGITRNAVRIKHISRERIRDELIRLIESDRPMQALYILHKIFILSHIIPELEDSIGVRQNQAHAFEVFEHLLRTLQHAADKKWSLEVRLAALLHDIGKPASRQWSEEKKDWTFHGHEVIGARMAKKILSELRFSKEVIDKVVTLVRWHMFFSDPDKISLSAVRRVVARVGVDHIKDLINIRVCDRIGTGRPKEHPFRLRKYMSMIDEVMRDPISVSMLKIKGEDIIELGETPGPRIGWILHALLEEVLDDPQKNTAENLKIRAISLQKLSNEELKELGEQGKERKGEEEEGAIQKIRAKHGVT